MKIQIPTIGTAIFMAVLVMGLLGMFVLVPIFGIQYTWNTAIHQLAAAPQINTWQATLLYLAGATIMYLTGIVQIEIDTESP